MKHRQNHDLQPQWCVCCGEKFWTTTRGEVGPITSLFCHECHTGDDATVLARNRLAPWNPQGEPA